MAPVTLDITIDDDFNSIQEVLEQIRPAWSWADVKRKPFTTGITNKICGFYLHTDSKWDDMVLVRLYGRNTDTIIDRKAERRNMSLLNSVGAGPALYAVLNNGLAYGFVKGVTVDEKTVRESPVRELIAGQVAKMHTVDLSKYPEIDQSTPMIYTKVVHFLSCIPQPLSDPKKQKRLEEFGKSMTDLREEVNQMIDLAKKHAKSPCGFTHNDLLLENIIYNAEESAVSFIDYEYGAYNFLYFDIANHFAEYAGVEKPDHSLYPDREYMLEWLSTYFSAYSGGNNSSFTTSMLNDICTEVNFFSLWSHLLWGIWSIVQAENSSIDFDFMAFATSRLGAYFDRKEEFISEIIKKVNGC